MKLFYLFMAGVVISCTAIGVAAVKLLQLPPTTTGTDANRIMIENSLLK